MIRRAALVSLCLLIVACGGTRVIAQTQDKPLPPPGIRIDGEIRKELLRRVLTISNDIERLVSSQSDSVDWEPDVEVLVRAVRLALDQNLFYAPQDADVAFELLDEANRRLAAVSQGKRGLELLTPAEPVAGEPTLVVGGFVSRVDNSIQPFGLVIPSGDASAQKQPRRLDVWLHGRGDNKLELAFLKERMTKVGEYAPPDTYVLHPFGRHCNAFKFAGETDVYEAMAHVQGLVAVDPARIAIRGFSMGGAGCWHLAVHDPGRWFAANPGAGFVDTIVYQGWEKKPPYPMTEARERLLRWYDVLPWAENLRNTRVVAYSGEVDKQRQAADRVEQAAKELGLEMTHVIGAGMAHKIDPPSAKKIDDLLTAWAADLPPSPTREIDFVTYTLRYSTVDWLQVTGLVRHWDPGRVRARIVDEEQVVIDTEGVTGLRLDFGRSAWPAPDRELPIAIDGQNLSLVDQSEAEGLQCGLIRDARWRILEPTDTGLRKRPGLQGPIDDAFCERFLFVLPSRPAIHGAAQRWIDRELRYAQDRWKRLMRGDVRVVLDTALTEEQVATCNLICFGDFASNRYLASIAGQLPIQWDREQLRVGSESFDPVTHVAAFCYPNPMSPDRYIVVNSGMTFREFSNASNARQVAMLPDWAVLDVGQTDNSIFAGGVVAEGFFDEQWQLTTPPE